jgi:hypothetical protein
VLIGCSGIKVSTDHNREFDFTRFKTYEWMADKPPVLRDPLLDTSLVDRRVKRAVETELQIKGYTKSASGQPDFFIAYHVGSQSQTDVSTCGYHYPVSPRCWGQEIETNVYSEGTLILDIVEPEDLELVWRGTATAVIEEPEQLEETVNKVVKKMLAEFPPGS